MKPTILGALMGISLSLDLLAASVTVSVPGVANPYLAGLPAGVQASLVATVPPTPPDVAPDQSPVQVPGLFLKPGDALTFQVTGRVSHCASGDPGPCCGLDLADGGDCTTGHLPGSENGFSDVLAPFNSLVGVFLGDECPCGFPAPPRLDFSTSGSRDYTELAPALRQVFFIGDGLRKDGSSQRVLPPEGATRLYLATMDTYGWFNNRGAFSVTVITPKTPESPANLSLSNYAGITVSGLVGSKHRIEFSTTLAPNTWLTLTNILLLQSSQFVLDPTPVGNGKRFYRCVQEQ